MATNIVYFYGQSVVTEKNVRYKQNKKRAFRLSPKAHLFCAIIIDDNRVCRVVLPSFSMNGGDVYGTILFSRLNVFWNVHDSIAYVHYFEHKKVILHIEKPPLNFAG